MDGAGKVAPGPGVWIGAGVVPGLTGAVAVGVLEGVAVPLPAAAAAQSNGIGYYVLTSNGGVHNYGAPWYGSDAYKLPAGVTAAGIAADPVTGGYWILKSDGGVDAFHAPWHGSLRGQIPAGRAVIGIAGTANGGYLVLTSNGGGAQLRHALVRLRRGQAADRDDCDRIRRRPATGGYWIMKSDGNVDSFHAPWFGSAPMRGQAVTGFTGTPGGGYLC